MTKQVKKIKDTRNDLSNYEPLLLSTQELFDKYFDAAAPLIQKSIDKSMDGEMTVEDIRALALSAQMYIMVLKSDAFDPPDVKFVLVVEIINYPQYKTMNVVCIGGSNLRILLKKYWPFICGWAYIVGVRKMECTVPPSIERILQGVGFHRSHIRMYQNLGFEK